MLVQVLKAKSAKNAQCEPNFKYSAIVDILEQHTFKGRHA